MRFAYFWIAAGIVTSAPIQAAEMKSNFDGDTAAHASGQEIEGWTVMGPGQRAVYLLASDYAESSITFNTHSGSGALDLTGENNQGPTAGVYRDLTTTAGQAYAISFFVGNATGSADGLVGNSAVYLLPSSVKLQIDGASAGVFTNADIAYGAVSWREFTQQFVASGPTTRIAFLNATPTGDNYAGLDDVSLTAVPEPASWAMLVIGFAAAGASIRRRRPAMQPSWFSVMA